MRLSKLKIRNFRCFGPEENTIEFDKLTSFIGCNSSGKTACIHALLKIFGETTFSYSLHRSDFHVPKGKSPEEFSENNLYIEAVFTFQELEEVAGSYSVPIFFKNFVVDDVSLPPYLRIRLEASWKKSSSPDGSIESNIYYITTSEKEEIREEDKKTASRHDLSHINIIYVPAIRNPAEQLKNVSGTILSRVLNGINWSDATKENIKYKIREVDAVFDQETGVDMLKKAIKNQWKNYHSDYRYTDASMKFNSTDLDTMLKKVEVKFSPTETTRDYDVEELGDGLRSLFYLSLVNSLLDIENTIMKETMEIKDGNKLSFNITPPVLTIVAVEEPENHISPQLLGKIVSNLNNISEKDNAQTILTSHSPAIIKRVEPESIRHFRMCKNEICTKVKKITLPEVKGNAEIEAVYKYIKEAVQAYPDIYFSRLVILGEGDSEEIILPRIIESLGKNIDSCGISVVPLGGRHVNHFWKLLNDLEIPYITLLDFDRERFGGCWGRIKYVLNQLIELGVDKNKLLLLGDGTILSDASLEKMHKRDVKENVSYEYGWIKRLEDYNVFFSYPLDIDFMMLESYESFYKSILSGNEGPYIKGNRKIIDIEKDNSGLPNTEYIERIENDIRATLKSEGLNGFTYTGKQKALMVWYNYFFLNRGKPTTHRLALSLISEVDIFKSLPEPLKRLVQATKNMLKDDPYSVVGEMNEKK